MSKFVVSGVVGDQETFFVAGGGSADDASAAHSGLDDRDEGTELRLEDTVEVVGATGCDQAVAVCQFRKHSNVV
jgi:hypothetical protein